MRRFEATCHNAKELRCRRGLDNFGEIITRLALFDDLGLSMLPAAA